MEPGVSSYLGCHWRMPEILL